MIPLPNTPGVFNYTAPAYSNFRHTTIPSIKIDQLINPKMKLSGYYSATKTFSPQNNGFTEAVYRAAAAERVWRRPYALTWIRRSLRRCCCTSAPVICTRPILRPLPLTTRSSCFPDGVPFTASNFFPYMAGMYSTNGGGWSGGGGFPGVTNTGVAFTLTPVANDYKPTFNANLTWVQGQPYLQAGGDSAV